MKKLRTYEFWVKLASAVILLFRIIGSEFGLDIDTNIFMDIVTGVAGVLVVLGIIQAPSNLMIKKSKNTCETITQSNEENVVDEAINEKTCDNFTQIRPEENVVDEAINEEICDNLTQIRPESDEFEAKTAENSQNITQIRLSNELKEYIKEMGEDELISLIKDVFPKDETIEI